MITKKHIPEIRFKGFDEDWEVKPLEEIFLRIRNAFVGTATPYYVSRGHFYLESNNIKNGLINRKTEIFINDDFHYKQKDKWLKTGDIVMVQSGHVGHSAVIPQELNNSAAHALIMFTNYKQETNPYFLNYQFLTDKVKLKIDKVTTGNTIKHILSSDMKLFECSFADIGEQNKIGTFFQNIDQVILLQRRKHKQMHTLKQSLLAKMFPRTGQTKPEVRLKGFSDDWVESNLGDLAQIRRGASPRPIQDPKWFDKNSKVGWLRISDVSKQEGRIYNIEQRLSLEGQAQTLVLNVPHLILSIAATIGKPVVNYVPTGIHDGFVVFLDLKADKEFLFQWLEVFRVEWQKLGQSGSQINLNSEIVKRQSIMLPPLLEEQTAIGQFFKQLDNTLALQSKKIKVLENIKKSLLAKIFV